MVVAPGVLFKLILTVRTLSSHPITNLEDDIRLVLASQTYETGSDMRYMDSYGEIDWLCPAKVS